MEKFDFKNINEESELVPGASLEIFEGTSSKSTEEICASAATIFRKIECGARKTLCLLLLK